ncbi:MAG: peptide ABC transporter substrate-binding protein [Acidimicrobiaceae bacterium]|nr:peptide ABC transporter substrate-binding protein [Acidimicrobiaceae bacterium]
MSWKKLFVLLSVFAVFTAACGSDDDVSSDDGGADTSADDTASDDSADDSADDAGDDALEDTSDDEVDESDVPEGSTAGEGGNLLLLQWQAPSQANPYLSGGTKDLLASSLVLEPLAELDSDGVLVTALAAEIPSAGNGGIAADGLSITWTLRDDVVWADGSPFTSADVLFTYDYCADEATGCASDAIIEIASVVADDDHTVTFNFNDPQPYPFKFGVGYQSPIIQKAQMEACIGAAAVACSEQNFSPVGTGPYVITELRPEDTVTYAMNENYRGVPDGLPFFGTVEIKGGGDAEAAARSVLEVGEADYAWNLQVAPEILAPMADAGIGRLASAFTANVEHINLNQTDPYDDTPSEGEPHALFVDNPDLHRALSISINRDELVAVGYGPTGNPTCNIWPVGAQNSTNNDWCLTQNIDEANALLDGLGYMDTDGDGVREAAGFGPLEFDYVTSTNAVRQSNQELIANYWSQIGVKANMQNEDASLFFDGTCASDACIWKFFTPMEMFTNGASTPYAPAYMSGWTSDQMPTADTAWGGSNIPRLNSPAYDELYAEASTTALDDPRLIELVIAMNDNVSTSAIIPLIHRASASAWSNEILGTGNLNGWDSEYWNIEGWYRG